MVRRLLTEKHLTDWHFIDSYVDTTFVGKTGLLAFHRQISEQNTFGEKTIRLTDIRPTDISSTDN